MYIYIYICIYDMYIYIVPFATLRLCNGWYRLSCLRPRPISLLSGVHKGGSVKEGLAIYVLLLYYYCSTNFTKPTFVNSRY